MVTTSGHLYLQVYGCACVSVCLCGCVAESAVVPNMSLLMPYSPRMASTTTSLCNVCRDVVGEKNTGSLYCPSGGLKAQTFIHTYMTHYTIIMHTVPSSHCASSRNTCLSARWAIGLARFLPTTSILVRWLL